MPNFAFPRHVPTSHVLAAFGISYVTLYKWQDLHEFPQPLRVGRNRLWPIDEIRTWMEKHREVRRAACV